MTDVPTVDIDCGFLLGAITMIGTSLAIKFFKKKNIKNSNTKDKTLEKINHEIFFNGSLNHLRGLVCS